MAVQYYKAIAFVAIMQHKLAIATDCNVGCCNGLQGTATEECRTLLPGQFSRKFIAV